MFVEKTNRSHSESDIYISEFDKLSLSSRNLFNQHLQSSCSSIVRRIYIEEILSPGGKEAGTVSTAFSETNMTYAMTSKSKPSTYTYIEDEEISMDVDASLTDERFPKMMGTYTEKLKTVPRLRKSDFIDEDHCTNDKDIPVSDQTNRAKVIHINSIKKKGNTTKIVVFVGLLSLLLFFYSDIISNIYVNHDIQVENIEKDLLANMHGQKHLIDVFTNILKHRTSWSHKLKVIGFVGSQGVGKTFFASLIKKHFPPGLSHDIYSTLMLHDGRKKDIINALSTSALNLIVIDDLNYSDIKDIFTFANSLPEDCFILLITIFNVHYRSEDLNSTIHDDDIHKLRNYFDGSGVQNHELFIFRNFTPVEIEDWVAKQLKLKNVPLSASEKILQIVLNNHDSKHGLKGLHSKISMELEKYRE